MMSAVQTVQLESLPKVITAINDHARAFKSAEEALDKVSEAVRLIGKQMQPQGIVKQVESCRTELALFTGAMAEGSKHMQEMCLGAKESQQTIEQVCAKSLDDWENMLGRITHAVKSLDGVCLQTDGMVKTAVIVLNDVEAAKQAMGDVAGNYESLRGDIQSEIQGMRQQAEQAKNEAQEFKSIYSQMLDDLQATSEMHEIFQQKKEALVLQREIEGAALKVLLEQYRHVMKEQQETSDLIRQQREADSNVIRELMEQNWLVLKEQEKVSLQIQRQTQAATEMQEETRMLLSLVEGLKMPDNEAMVKVFESFQKWQRVKEEEKPDSKGGLFAGLFDQKKRKA